MVTAIEEHDRHELRKTMTALRTLLIEEGLPIGHWHASIRWSLTRQVLRHFATGARSSSDGSARALELRYRRHLLDWTPERIDREWARYCRELGAILDALDFDLDAGARDPFAARPHLAAGAGARR